MFLFCYRIGLDYLTENFRDKEIAAVIRVHPRTIRRWKDDKERSPRSMEHTREIMFLAWKCWAIAHLLSPVIKLDNKLDEFRTADYLHRAGLSDRQIAEVLCKNRSTIYRRLNKGAKAHPGSKPMPRIEQLSSKALSRQKRDSMRDEAFWGCYPIISRGSADPLLDRLLKDRRKRKRTVAEMAMQDKLDELYKKYLKGNKKAPAEY